MESTLRAQIYGGKERRVIYLAGENFDYVWSEDDIKTIRRVWNRGASIQEIAIMTDRKKEEIMILLMDLSHQGRLARRIYL